MALVKNFFTAFEGCGKNLFQTRFKSYRIAVSPDKSMILCYHPKQPFPYECSKPIIRSKELEKEEKSSMINGQWLQNNDEGPSKEEISKMLSLTQYALRPRRPDRYKQKLKNERQKI